MPGHRRAAALCITTAVAAMTAAAALVAPSASASDPQLRGAHTVTHVAIVDLENKGFDETFGPGSPYTALTELAAQGQLLSQYYGIGHFSTPNYIAQISGQAPNLATQLDCSRYLPFVGEGTGAYGQALGRGCVFPSSVRTVADQLEAKGLTWRSYQENMGIRPAEAKQTCVHPELGAVDPTVAVGTGYSTRHNPFMYFHSIIDSPSCDANVVGLDRLPADLADEASTPNYLFITPDQCNDGHTVPCEPGLPSGPDAVNRWLRTWIPQLQQAPAFRDHGLIVITFDEAEPIGPDADSSACCGEIPGPNPTLVGDISPIPGIILHATGGPGIFGPGGGRVGAVLLGPGVRAGTVNDTPYNHYSLLRSVEDMFGLAHLGYADLPDVRPFGTDLFRPGWKQGVLDMLKTP
jgi:hypothetical protein